MPLLFICTGIALENKPGNNSNVPELAPAELRSVYAALQVCIPVFRVEQRLDVFFICRYWLVTQQFKTIIIHGYRKGNGYDLRQTVSQQRSHRLVYQPA